MTSVQIGRASRVPRRSAIVTGASGGIGVAVTRMLVEEGFAVTMTARQPEKLSLAAARLRGGDGELHEVAADLTLDGEIERVAKFHSDRFECLDLLVNNAGVALSEEAGRPAQEAIDRQVDLSLRGTIVLYREMLDMLLSASAATGSAFVVNIASILARHPMGWLGTYSAAKAGMVAYTEAMNESFVSKGVKSTVICPGMVETAMTQMVEAEGKIDPQDIAELIRMLLQLSPAAVVPEIPIVRRNSAFSSPI